MTTGALAKTAQMLDGAHLMVEDDFCINLRARGVICKRCEKACQSEAIQVSAEGVEVDEEICTACGACVPACPAGALRLSGFDPTRFLADNDGAEEVQVTCLASPPGDNEVAIPCHLMLDRRLLAAAFAQGTRSFLLRGLQHCSACHRGDARDHIARLLRSMEKWFGGEGPVISRSSGNSGQSRGRRSTGGLPTDRRGFLRFMRLQAGTGAAGLLAVDPDADWIEDESADEPRAAGGFPKHPVPYRAILAGWIHQLPWAKDRPLPWHTRSIGEDCTACMVCAERCPTGALEDNSDRSARRISFDPSLCTNCTLCQRICPQQAVQPRRVRSAEEASAPRAILMHQVSMVCERCGSGFVPIDSTLRLCTSCVKEREMDDEWLDMLQN